MEVGSRASTKTTSGLLVSTYPPHVLLDVRSHRV